jgi:hypothetical protein
MKYLIILILPIFISCSAAYRNYHLDPLPPMNKNNISGEYIFNGNNCNKKVLILNDTIAYLHFNTLMIFKDIELIINDTLYPRYSYYCIKLGEAKECPDCPFGAECDCWPCIDSAQYISTYIGKNSSIYVNNKGKLTCLMYIPKFLFKTEIQLNKIIK